MSRKNARKRIRSLLDALKNVSSCVDCGITDPGKLTFDHQLGEVKRFDLAQGTKYSISLVLKELEKCHVVCVICHRAREDVRLRDKSYQETKSAVEAVARVFHILAILGGSDVAYREYRDISKEKEKKRRDRQRYKKRRAQAKAEIVHEITSPDIAA